MNHRQIRRSAVGSTNWWGATVIVGLTLFISAPASAEAVPEAAVSDEEVTLAHRVCGPHCARWVLQRYGIEADLLELVQEMQWPEFEKGTSFAGLEQSLQKRGLCVEALASPLVGDWNVPVIIQEQYPGESISHFAVIDPELGYWDPARLDYGERNPRRYSGHLLAVYRCPQTTPESAWSVLDYLLAAGVLCWGAAATYFVASRPAQPPG